MPSIESIKTVKNAGDIDLFKFGKLELVKLIGWWKLSEMIVPHITVDRTKQRITIDAMKGVKLDRKQIDMVLHYWAVPYPIPSM